MCVVKSPTIETSSTEVPEPTVIRNPFLDGIDPQTKALRRGRSSLRIERGGGVTPSPSAPSVGVLPPSINPTPILNTPSGIPQITRGGGSGNGLYLTRSYDLA